jgi:hypothetical protein
MKRRRPPERSWGAYKWAGHSSATLGGGAWSADAIAWRRALTCARGSVCAGVNQREVAALNVVTRCWPPRSEAFDCIDRGKCSHRTR